MGRQVSVHLSLTWKCIKIKNTYALYYRLNNNIYQHQLTEKGLSALSVRKIFQSTFIQIILNKVHK